MTLDDKPRRPPPRRTRPTVTDSIGVKSPGQPPTHPNGTPDALAAMEQQQWDARIAARRRPLEDGPAKRHPTDYNYPLMWARRPDGDIVQLQSDPNNRMMYEDLGFVFLSPGETRQWLDVRQPQVLAEQREKAAIITALRRYESRMPTYSLEYDQPDSDELFSDMSIERLREVHREIQAETGATIRVPRSRFQSKTATSTDASASGIESGGVDPRVAGLLDGSRTPGNGRSVEVQPGRALPFTH